MKRLIIAITGASGAIYGIRALQALQTSDEIETHLVISPSAQYTIAESISGTQIINIADVRTFVSHECEVYLEKRA